jgi:hypothetical protein
MSLTVSCSAWTDNQDHCPYRPRSKSIEHKVRIRVIYHALGRCSRRLACIRLLAKFRMEFRFTDEAKISAASMGSCAAGRFLMDDRTARTASRLTRGDRSDPGVIAYF